MKITDALRTEHAIFLRLFHHIESALPQLSTPAEVQTLARLVEALLQEHGGQETDLAYAALDQVLAHRSQLERLHQDHEEIDDQLQAVPQAPTGVEARRRLLAALAASRAHFQFEERHVFPLLEQALEEETLRELGQAWQSQRAAAPR